MLYFKLLGDFRIYVDKGTERETVISFNSSERRSEAHLSTKILAFAIYKGRHHDLEEIIRNCWPHGALEAKSQENRENKTKARPKVDACKAQIKHLKSTLRLHGILEYFSFRTNEGPALKRVVGYSSDVEEFEENYR